MPFVTTAMDYDPDAMGSSGRAERMILCQHNFPEHEYSYNDRLVVCEEEFMSEHEPERLRECYNTHIGTNEGGFNFWLKHASEEEILNFLIDIFQVEREGWTGFRILVTVNKRGWNMATWELFAKHEKSSTKLKSYNPHRQHFLSETPEDRMYKLLGRPPHNRLM